jgi:hypothetical protein
MHLPISVEDGHEGKLNVLRNRQVQTNRTVANNKLDDIIIRDKKGICMLIKFRSSNSSYVNLSKHISLIA